MSGTEERIFTRIVSCICIHVQINQLCFSYLFKMESSCLLLASGTQGNQLNPFFFRVRLQIFFLKIDTGMFTTQHYYFHGILKSLANAGIISTWKVFLMSSLFYFQPSIITKLTKFEVDLPSHQKSTKQPLLERDVSMANM